MSLRKGRVSLNASDVPYFEFDGLRVDVRRRRLLRGGTPVPVTPKVFSLLLLLVQNAGRTLSKERIIAAVWPRTSASDANLTVNVATLRRALGEAPRDRKFIATIPSEGYRFIGEVRPIRTEDPDSVSPPIRRIAVLPFRSAGGTDDPFALGLTDALIGRLAGHKELAVPGILSAQDYEGNGIDPLGAGRELGADAVLIGSVRDDGRGREVSAQLIRVADGTVLCGDACREV